MIEFWNNRYAEPDYAYGKSPNAFFERMLEQLPLQGRVLFPAEGEGRNAVYGAQKGLQVVAFDISAAGKIKALQLAEERQVQIDYRVGTLEDLDLQAESFDAAVLTYAHFPPAIRPGMHAQIQALLKPGGLVILEGFSQNNLSYRAQNPGIGGPPEKELLYTTDALRDEFRHCEALLLEEVVVSLQEGKYHNGTGSVVRFVGRKR